jgi:hypothetical protein
MADKHQMNVAAFDAAFANVLETLAGSERITKETLKTVSRDVLCIWHQTGNVGYANKLLLVLTPINKKVAVAFFKRFSGYSFDDTSGMFTKKSKKRYEDAHKDCMEALDDPHFNIWTWADRHIEVQPKAFSLDSVNKYYVSALKQAQGAGLTQADVIRAIFSAGVEPSAVVAAFNEMAFKDAEGDTVEIPQVFGEVQQPAEESPL